MSLEGSLDVASADDGVTFTFAVTNAGDEPAELSFRSARSHDVAVLDDGREVWRWSDGRAFAQVLETATLHPGETTEFEVAWADPPPGDYEAVGTLTATGHDLEARRAFSV